MLAIVRSLEEFDCELRGLAEFEVYSDHKNLQYFMTVRKLTERQMRWSLTLSRYNFRIIHVSGANNGRADALSRRDQDLPKGAEDSRVQERNIQLIKPDWIRPKKRKEKVTVVKRSRVEKILKAIQKIGVELTLVTD